MFNHLISGIRRRLRRYRLTCYRALAKQVVNPYADIAELLDANIVRTVFDVGANVGQSAVQIARYFPQAEIHSFEPVQASYQAGLTATAHLTKIRWHRTAVSDRSGYAEFYSSGTSQLASLANPLAPTAQDTVEMTNVPVITLDDFCSEHKISRIDVLKTDTEGFDVQMLRGAERLFSAQSIGCVLCETGFNSTDKSHSSFLQVTAYLEMFGFKLYQIYGISDKQHFKQWGCTYGDALYVKQPLSAPSI